MNLLNRILQKWVAWVLPRPRFILGLALVLVIASLWAAFTRLEVQSDQLELISKRHPLIKLSDRLEEFNFYGKRTFAVVVKPPSQDRGIEFMNALVEKIHGDPEHFQEVFYRIEPDQFKKWLLYYLDEDELSNIRKTIEEHSDMVREMSESPDLLNFFKLVNREMASRMVGEFFTGFLNDENQKESEKEPEPMDLQFLIKVLDGLSDYLNGNPKYISPWSSFFHSGAWDIEKEGYLWEGNKKLLIAAVLPTKQQEGVTKTLGSLDTLRGYIRELRQSSFGDVEAGVTGEEALNNDEMRVAMNDMALATWLSLLGVMVLMVIFLRGFRHPFIITASLAAGLCWTFGWTAIFIGHLNILSIVFAPMLCGLGVDYGIHWFARFEEERDRTKADRLSIIRNVMEKSGPGIFLAGLSAAFSFLPFILTGFRGLIELGLITGMGILFTLLADFTVLPALARYMAVDSPRKWKSANPAVAGRKYLLQMGRRGVRTVLAAALVLVVISSFGASRVQFDLNPLRLKSPSSESVRWEKILVEQSEHSVLSAATLGSSPEEVKEKTAKLLALHSVSEVDTVFTLLPTHQSEKVPLLRSILASVPELEHSIPKFAEGPRYASLAPKIDPNAETLYQKELADTLERIRFKMQDDQAAKWGASKPLVEQMIKVRSSIDEVVGSIKTRPEKTSEYLFDYQHRFTEDLIDKWTLLKNAASAPPMRVQDIPPALRHQFLRGGNYLIRIYPKESIWDEGALTRFVNDIRSVDPDTVGDPVSLYVFSSAYKKASINASIYALISISLLLAVTFSIKLTIISLIPLLLGTIYTIGIMGAVGIDFNLANSIFMPLVVGAGVEYGIIILHRWREGRVGYGRLLFSTGKGVILAALTTTIGFGTLMISHHRGIFSLGFVAWTGSICVLISALFVLPSILSELRPPESAAKEGE